MLDKAKEARQNIDPQRDGELEYREFAGARPRVTTGFQAYLLQFNADEGAGS